MIFRKIVFLYEFLLIAALVVILLGFAALVYSGELNPKDAAALLVPIPLTLINLKLCSYYLKNECPKRSRLL